MSAWSRHWDQPHCLDSWLATPHAGVLSQSKVPRERGKLQCRKYGQRFQASLGQAAREKAQSEGKWRYPWVAFPVNPRDTQCWCDHAGKEAHCDGYCSQHNDEVAIKIQLKWGGIWLTVSWESFCRGRGRGSGQLSVGLQGPATTHLQGLTPPATNFSNSRLAWEQLFQHKSLRRTIRLKPQHALTGYGKGRKGQGKQMENFYLKKNQ